MKSERDAILSWHSLLGHCIALLAGTCVLLGLVSRVCPEGMWSFVAGQVLECIRDQPHDTCRSDRCSQQPPPTTANMKLWYRGRDVKLQELV